MKNIFSTKLWITAIGLLLLVALSAGVIYAQGNNGTIIVNACLDQNADGDCNDPTDGPAPAGLEACLDSSATCLAIPATFTTTAGSHTAFLRFPGASQGYYPTTPDASISLAAGGQENVTLGAVYPVHPKGVAVHEALNKVYVAFQGPTVISDVVTIAATPTVTTKPYPFVAVIDGGTDEVLQTIPGGPNSIGREPWGVAVSGDNVYVGSFGEGRVSVIDANSDTVITNLEPTRDDFQPTAPAVNPINGQVHFPDFRGGRIVIIDGLSIVDEPSIDLAPASFSPFEMIVADDQQVGHNFVTMRDALNPQRFKLASLNGTSGELSHPDFQLPDGGTGMPHAIGLWQESGMTEPHFFVTYAGDPRSPANVLFPNPDKLAVYGFPIVNPKDIIQRNINVAVGDYAEVGLVHNPATNHMLGTFAGFAYDGSNGDEAACSNAAHGGTYAVDFGGQVLAGDAPGIWKLPGTVIGNPPLVSAGLQWDNPFEIAINPNNSKVYVTDRCWSDFPGGGQPTGGAVLIFTDTAAGPANGLLSEPITLTFSGPASVDGGATFSVDAVARNVLEPGLYGVQFEINYDPALISVLTSSLQVNSNLSFVPVQTVDNATGKITLAATRQGNVPGLTGDVTLLTFQATAADTSDTATFTFGNEIIGDAQARVFNVVTETYSVSIGGAPPTEPEVNFSSASYNVGEGDGSATITVTLSATSTNQVTVDFATSDGTATAGDDYTAVSGTLTITPGAVSQTFTLPITDDGAVEADETVSLTLANATNATLGSINPATLTIADNDALPSGPTVSFSSASYNVGEGDGSATITVTLSATSTNQVTVDFATSDGTATVGDDYTAVSGTLTITPDAVSQTFTLPITDDGAAEADETVSLTLANATNATIGGTNPVTLTIADNDAPPGGSATVSGQVILPGQAGDDFSGATVTISDTAQSDTTDTGGNFTIANVITGAHTAITANAPGYLSAVCTTPTVTAPVTSLAAVTLLSGDLNDDDEVDITDATTVGASFGLSDPVADINRDGTVNVLDIILVSVNFGQTGPQVWVCQ